MRERELGGGSFLGGGVGGTRELGLGEGEIGARISRLRAGGGGGKSTYGGTYLRT